MSERIARNLFPFPLLPPSPPPEREESVEEEYGLLRRIIPRGTLLFRATDTLENLVPSRISSQINYDHETRKSGLYFSTYPFLAISIAVKLLKRDCLLGQFVVTEDIIVADGKYSFVDFLNPTEYQYSSKGFIFKDIQEQQAYLDYKQDYIQKHGGTQIFTREGQLLPKFNINHFDSSIWPALEDNEQGQKVEKPQEFWDNSVYRASGWVGQSWMGEVFLGNAIDRAKLRLTQAYIVKRKKIIEICQKMQWFASTDTLNINQWLSLLEKTSDLSRAPDALFAPRLGGGKLKRSGKKSLLKPRRKALPAKQ